MPEQKSALHLSTSGFTNKISNISQVGGIETSVIDNGSGRGTRIAWFNTGAGLRFKVVLDRAMDIAESFFNQYSIAWISSKGIAGPQPFSNHGLEWLRTFGGGLLTTCGLSHVGGPEKDEYGERGLHGQISNIAAEVETIIQPDPFSGKMEMSITGIMRETQIFGPSLQLKRTVSAILGENWLNIQDEVINRGNTPAPHMLLYHFNFGWPLVDEGARLYYEGLLNYVDENRDKHIFNSHNDFRMVPAPMPNHKGSGEAAAYFDIKPASDGKCVCGIYNEKLELGVSLTFNKNELPWLTNWQHWAPGEYVTGLEPCTNPPIGQAAARERNELQFIQPGEKRTYNVRLKIVDDVSELE